MKTKVVLHIIAGTVLIVGFQNCTQTKFGSGTTSQYLSALSSSGTPEAGDATGDLNQEQMGIGTTSPTTPPPDTTTPPPDTTTGSLCQTEPGSNHGSEHTPHTSCHNAQENCDSDADAELVACILVDHGKSLKLGLVTTTTMGGVNSVAESVCISKAACLGDVAKAFKVEGAYERGYCAHNPHVKRLTDAEVKNLLGL